ncbi:hypothetical protein, partial [Paraburkholderia sp. RL17-373-BIF-A]|uniref:hypothetical protein n=1 Tax=Paraburkholderia sp. RL17-373-BIF-A TaxID=3031629 RepID=UPI0038BD0481
MDIGVGSNYQGVDGQFVARWENARLQVCAATPAAAIAGLHSCATTCPHVAGNALPYPAMAPVVEPSPMSTTVAADYELFIDCVKARRGFWTEAEKLTSAASGTVTRWQWRTRHDATMGDE